MRLFCVYGCMCCVKYKSCIIKNQKYCLLWGPEHLKLMGQHAMNTECHQHLQVAGMANGNPLKVGSPHLYPISYLVDEITLKRELYETSISFFWD